MQSIPFHKPSIGPEEIAEVVDTLKSGWLTTGPKCKQFEAQFAAYVERKHAVALNSCTAALHLALEAIGLKANETVLVPTLTFAATAEVVRYFNARPLFVDCRLADFNMDMEDAERRLEEALERGARVKAIIPVHYAGQVGDMAGLGRLARRFKLRIIEDAAHCCPAFFRKQADAPWQPSGTLGDISCYSFYANKTITTGEGGMACTDSAELADRMRIMSLHGISRDAWKRFTSEGSWYYEVVAPGYKYNLTDVAAAIGLQQLRKADALRSRRAMGARIYRELLGDVEELILPVEDSDRIHSWHLYVVRVKLGNLTIDRGEIIELLKKEGIGTSVHWMPLHMQPYYSETYGYQPEDLPQAAKLYPEIISLPLYPDMTEWQIEHVCGKLKTILANHLAGPRTLRAKQSLPEDGQSKTSGLRTERAL